MVRVTVTITGRFPLVYAPSTLKLTLSDALETFWKLSCFHGRRALSIRTLELPTGLGTLPQFQTDTTPDPEKHSAAHRQGFFCLIHLRDEGPELSSYFTRFNDGKTASRMDFDSARTAMRRV